MRKILTPGEQRFLQKPSLLLLVIFLVGLLVFLPTLRYDFVWDDDIFIKNNSLIKSLSNAPRFLFSKIYLNQQDSDLYRPLLLFSISLDHALFRDYPGGYHLTSSLLHGLNSSLVAYLALLLLESPYAALLAGALFALHPVHPEAVAFVSARADILFTFFSLLTLVALLKKSKTALVPCLLAPLFFFLALLSKETALVILFPWAFWLYRRSKEEPHPGRATLQKLMPAALVALLYFILRYLVLKPPVKKMDFNLFNSPFLLPELFIRYLSGLIFPLQRASFFYNAPRAPYPLDLKFGVLAVLTLLLLGAMAYLIYRRRETAPLLTLIILPCLPPLFFSLGVDIIMIDRYLYLPTAGLALLAAWGFLEMPDQAKKWAAAAMGLILIIYLGGTLWRTPLWKNDITFFEGLKKEYPASPYVRANLGIAYQHRNRYIEAYQEISSAIKLDPLDFRYPMNLGRLYLRLGEIPPARAAFTESLRLNSHSAPALEGLGLTYLLEGDYDTALKYLDLALQADPQYEPALKNKQAALAMKNTLRK